MLRRTKFSTDREGRPILILPPADVQVIYCELTEAEKDFYEALFRRSKQCLKYRKPRLFVQWPWLEGVFDSLIKSCCDFVCCNGRLVGRSIDWFEAKVVLGMRKWVKHYHRDGNSKEHDHPKMDTSHKLSNIAPRGDIEAKRRRRPSNIAPRGAIEAKRRRRPSHSLPTTATQGVPRSTSIYQQASIFVPCISAIPSNQAIGTYALA